MIFTVSNTGSVTGSVTGSGTDSVTGSGTGSVTGSGTGSVMGSSWDCSVDNTNSFSKVLPPESVDEIRI